MFVFFGKFDVLCFLETPVLRFAPCLLLTKYIIFSQSATQGGWNEEHLHYSSSKTISNCQIASMIAQRENVEALYRSLVKDFPS